MSLRSVRSGGPAKSTLSVTEEVPVPRQLSDVAAPPPLALPAAGPLHPPHPQPPLVVLPTPRLPGGKGHAVAQSLVGLAGAAEVVALVDVSRSVTRPETEGVAAVHAAANVPLVTGSAAIHGSAGPAGAAGAGLRPVAAAAERGGTAGITGEAEVAVRAAAGGNRKPPARTGRETGGKRGAGAMKRIRGRKRKI